MHYYSFHVSDYIHDTAHLSIYEDLAFRRLLDLYYTSEKPIPNKTQEVSRRIRLTNNETAVQSVLQEFFSFDEERDCWFHKRCDKAIADYQAKAERNRAVGKLGGRPKSNPNAIPQETQMVSKDNPNHKPLTNNQDKKEQRGSRLAKDLIIPIDWLIFCKKERPELEPSTTFERFKDYWIAQAGQKGVKLDWFATWRNWVRNTNAPKIIFSDIARVTVPSKNEPDPALEKIKADAKKAAPLPDHIRQAMNQLRNKL
jgi:uncharacterized protein YdaU (DUF1376 family)